MFSFVEELPLKFGSFLGDLSISHSSISSPYIDLISSIKPLDQKAWRGEECAALKSFNLTNLYFSLSRFKKHQFQFDFRCLGCGYHIKSEHTRCLGCESTCGHIQGVLRQFCRFKLVFCKIQWLLKFLLSNLKK